ncbi:MAG: molybdate ABC transporter substrate-binding protein [Solirubrobacterales bacterium]
MAPKQYLCKSGAVAAIAATLAFSVGGCSTGTTGSDGGEPPLTISAASSLTDLLRSYGKRTPGEERFSFAGSDQLAAQIRAGAEPDLFASASLDYPRELADQGLVGEPVAFASNRLVIAVATSSGLTALDQLAGDGVDLTIGAAGVPAGDYAREAIRGLPAPVREGIEANVRSQESDVRGVVGKVSQGAADAGFAYASDVAAVEGLRAIELPAGLQPRISYAISVVSSSDQPERANGFIDELTSARGRRLLVEAGFVPPPSGDTEDPAAAPDAAR